MASSTLNSQQQADSDALASAVDAAAHHLGLGPLDHTSAHHYHHPLHQPSFSHSDKDADDVDVQGLDLPEVDDEDLGTGDEGLDLGMGGLASGQHMDAPRGGYERPPSIRKACDLCHAAKQRCSGDRPICTRCASGGWDCVYAPRQRRRTVPKDQKAALVAAVTHPHAHPHSHIDVTRAANLAATINIPRSQSPQTAKKRKLQSRDGTLTYGSEPIPMKLAMGMAVELGLAPEEEGEDLMTMEDSQMLESIAIDGYLADLPLATFQHNLPYQAPPVAPENTFNPDDPFPAGEMDQHTTSALRDAIFSLNESTTGGAGDGDAADGSGEGMDPHLALLDLSHAMPEGNEEGTSNAPNDINLNLSSLSGGPCSHPSLVPHVLALLAHHALEPKPGSNTPLTLSIFTPLARSLRLFHAIASCSHCSTSPHQTLPQLALLSRSTTILTFPCPPVNNSTVSGSARITLHGARLAGTGLSEAIEQHIVGVVWDSWRAAVREVFANFERKAQEVITQTAMQVAQEGAGPAMSSPETQRAGLMFQAMSRLVTAMDEVEGN